MQQRNIVTYIILSIFTCGIFGMYWFYLIADDVHRARSTALPTTPVVTLLLCMVTCGIYTIYAYYQWGKAIQQIAAESNITIEDRSVIYIVLSLFGMGIINMALIQGDLNIIAGPVNPM